MSQNRTPKTAEDAYKDRVLARIRKLERQSAGEIESATQQLRGLLRDESLIEDAEILETTSPEATPAAAIEDVDLPAPVAAPQSEVIPSSTEYLRHWDEMRSYEVKPQILDRNLVITGRRSDPAAASFDVLRARLFSALNENGWKRVGITSPTKGCGKSFTSMNLAMTLSRYENSRTILMDMDMRHPALARYLGVKKAGSLGDVLRGEISYKNQFYRIGENTLNIGRNLALALNDRQEPYAAELFQQPRTSQVFRQIEEELNPDVILYDLPPALAQDDVIAFRPFIDCILMVIGGGITKPQEVREVSRRIGEDKPVIGVVLNMSEDREDNTY